MQVGYRQKSRIWFNSWLSKIAGCAKCQKHLPTTMRCTSHSRRHTSECLFLTACSMDEYAEEKRTEKNLIVRSGISEAETTNNKRLRSTFCIEAIQTRSIARPLCGSRASCYLYCPKISVRLSVRLSVTCRYSIETAKHIIKPFHHRVYPCHSSFSLPNGMAN